MMKLLKVQDLADMLQVEPPWIYQKAQKGEIPALKIGRYWRFDADEIREWLLRQRDPEVIRLVEWHKKHGLDSAPMTPGMERQVMARRRS